MAKPPTPEMSQVEQFKEVARELGCNEDDAAFDEKLKGITRQKAEPTDTESRSE